MFALISSRMAAWGQPPVSIAVMRSVGRASLRMRNSASSRLLRNYQIQTRKVGKTKAYVNISFVVTAV